MEASITNYSQPPKKFADQLRMTAKFNIEILKMIAREGWLEGVYEVRLAHTAMLKKVEDSIQVIQCNIEPDFSCNVTFKFS